MITRVEEALDQNKISAGLFLDLKKAFDTVNHSILLQKLESIGIRGVALNWFQSYLVDRYLYVSVNNIESNVL